MILEVNLFMLKPGHPNLELLIEITLKLFNPDIDNDLISIINQVVSPPVGKKNELPQRDDI